MGANNFKTLPENLLLYIFESTIGEKEVGIQAPGPPRRDPGWNSVPDPGFKVPNGGMATHLVTKRYDLGSLGVPGPASTPGRAGGGSRQLRPHWCPPIHPRLLSPCWGDKKW